MGVAAGNDVALTSMVGEAISKEVSTIGINWLFAPVLEVVTDVTEPLDVSSRFSDTLEVVKDHARAIVQGFHNNHVASCAMETFTMSIQDIYTSMNFEERGDNTVGKTDHEELGPLRHLIEECCLDSIQLSSSVYQFHDQIRLGQSIREAVQMILRERLGCQSPVVVNCSALPPESNACVVHAPLRALLAGCDMIRLSNDDTTLIASIRAMHSAIQSSDLSDVSASAAASRIWNLKKNFTSWDSIFDSCDNASIDFSQHANFAQSAYRGSITALAPEPSPLLGFPSSSILLLLTPTVYMGTTSTSDPFEPLGRAISRSHSRIRHVPYTVSAGLTSTHMAFLSRALAVVLVLCNSSSAFTEVQNEFFNAVRNVVQQRESVADGEGLIKIVIGAGDPRDLKGARSDWWSVCCYDFSRGALEAVAEVIVGEKIASGQLPLHLN